MGPNNTPTQQVTTTSPSQLRSSNVELSQVSQALARDIETLTSQVNQLLRMVAALQPKT